MRTNLVVPYGRAKHRRDRTLSETSFLRKLMRWTVKQVVDAVAGKQGSGIDPLARVAGVSIDSRTLRRGELFIAIHGPRNDGHDYVAQSLEAGAVAAVVRGTSSRAIPDGCRIAASPFPTRFEALHNLARAVRKDWGRKICGITGSVGKTTTKEILAALLGSKLRVLKSEGNFNNEYGLPLTIFRLEETHEVAVLEMGMSYPRRIARLAAIAQPDVAIELRVSPAHLRIFLRWTKSRWRNVSLIEGLNGPNSMAILNADDSRVAAMAEHAPGRVIFYGIEKPAEFNAQDIEDRGAMGSAFTLVHNGTRSALKCLSRQTRRLECTCRHCRRRASGTSVLPKRRTVLPTLRTPAMRGELMRFSNGLALINDTYNSSPAALAGHDRDSGGDTRFSAAHPGRRRNARVGTKLETIASRRRRVCREIREN